MLDGVSPGAYLGINDVDLFFFEAQTRLPPRVRDSGPATPLRCCVRSYPRLASTPWTLWWGISRI